MVWVILCLMVDMIFLQRRFWRAHDWRAHDWRAHDWRAHDWRARCWLAHGFVIAVCNGRLSSRWSVGGLSVAWIGASPRFGPASALTTGMAGVRIPIAECASVRLTSFCWRNNDADCFLTKSLVKMPFSKGDRVCCTVA